MCGIAGLVGLPDRNVLHSKLQSMTTRLQHRGPDDQGSYCHAEQPVALGHTRLAILDLSSAGRQPMQSTDGRYVIVFNGEIYNFRELQGRLQQRGLTFRSHSDTEVILALYGLYGRQCVDHLEGMFAFAIWDHVEQSLFLARDPLGIKPLYLWQQGSALAFASEIRSLLQADLGPRQLSFDAAFHYLRLGSVPEPLTLVRDVSLLPAGHVAVFRAGQLHQQAYWSLTFTEAVADPQLAARTTRQALQESVERHFVSDVPVGLFLSGGLDSSALAAVAAAQGRHRLQTFCISFDNAEFNEGDLAARTAAHFGTRHTDWRMTAADGRQLAASYLSAMDQPTSDGFNTYCVSKLAHDCGIKVVLSGLGGDELFGGYPSFQRIPRLQQWHQRLKRTALGLPVRQLIQCCSRQPRWLRLAEFLESPGRVSDAWRAMRGFFTSAEACAVVSQLRGVPGWRPTPALTSLSREADVLSQPECVADQISRLELTGYMRNQLLRDSDVMSMAWGLELRVPFVDRRLAETVGSIAADVRLAAGKQLLVQAVPEIPAWVLAQPKRGFRFPFEEWAKSSWDEWFREIEASSPVRCRTWYRKWCLLVLQHFLKVNQITVPGNDQGKRAA